MFNELKANSLIAMRTAPNQCYTHIVERIMSILNICYQNMALERDTTEVADIIKKCCILGQLRQKTQQKDALEESLKSMISTFESRTERMAL